MASSPPAEFAHEYDPEALELLTPRGHAFRMYVAPRYRDHYVVHRYEEFSANLVASIVRRADMFIDIGASFGFYSLLAAERRPNLAVIALEPTPATCAVLERNVKLAGKPNIEIRQMAASNESGRRRFNVAWASDSCGFFPHPNVDTLQSIEVETTTIDALLRGREPASLLIKVDTEGNELAVLEGMRETLARCEDVRLVVELAPRVLQAAGTSPSALLACLATLGFQSYLIDEDKRRFYRVTPDRIVSTARDYANLYCVRSRRSASVCFFSHSAQLGGSEQVLTELVDDLIVDHGAICSVVMPEWGPLAEKMYRAGAAPIIVPYSWWCWERGSGVAPEQKSAMLRASAIATAEAARTDIRAFDPDIIWSQTLVIPWGAVTASLLGKPHIWYITEFGERDHGLEFFAASAKQTLREIVGGADFIYTASNSVARALFADIRSDRVRTLYCDVRPTRSGDASPDGVRYFTIADAVKLGIFTTLHASKGQEDLIHAVAALTSRGRNVELVVSGYEFPNYRSHLEDLAARGGIADRVHFVGHLDNPYDAMSATDIVVSCSRNEAFGRTGAEAMVLGKPFVYAGTGGMTEYMIDGTTGLAYVPGDVEELTQRLDLLITAPERQKIMGEAGRVRAAALFGREAFSGEVNRRLLALRDTAKAAAKMPSSIASYFDAAPRAMSPFALCFAIVLLLTLVRLIGLRYSVVDLFVDEAQYWDWSRELAFGYFSKPPLLAWTIAGAQAICGSGEACIRAPAPIFYCGTALLGYAIARELYDERAGFWTALSIALAPGVAFSSRVISTDVPFLFFWAAALLAYVKLIRGSDFRWALTLGIALGLGLLAKYAMIYFLAGIAIVAAFDCDARQALRRKEIWIALAIGAALLAPNLLWNALHRFDTFRQTSSLIETDRLGFKLGRGLEFLGAQFGVIGPVVFGGLLALFVRWSSAALRREDRWMMAFAIPPLAFITIVAFVNGAYANWAAASFVSATVVVAAVLVRERRWRWLAANLGIGIAVQVLLIVGDLSADKVTLSAFGRNNDPYQRTMGWRSLAENAERMARQIGAWAIVSDNRYNVAALVYYLRDTKERVRDWPKSADAENHFERTIPLTGTEGEPLLFVTDCPIQRDFEKSYRTVVPLGSFDSRSGPHSYRRFFAYSLSGSRGAIQPDYPCP